MHILVYASAIFLMSCADERHHSLNLIPMPVHIEPGTGSFAIRAGTALVADGRDSTLQQVAEYLSSRVEAIAGFPLPVGPNTQGQSDGQIMLRLSDAKALPHHPEGYRLVIDETGILLEGRKPEGVFRGAQTLLQILSDQISFPRKDNRSLKLPALSIVDFPRYPYRGMHLDVSRHFFSVAFIKEYIDLLAAFKFNSFHWHLTDDQGWRIEIDTYPQLTQVGSWRQAEGGGRYGGFYTKDEVREIVAYAADRFITIVPEIEMPGHSQAALAAYPEYSCSGGPLAVSTEWGVRENVYCAGNDGTFTFLEGILTEVLELFPGSYIHIGGDECPKTRWQQCPKCQARIRAEHLADEFELQSYFIKRIECFLLANGRRLIGWDEILEGGLARSATVMSWRGMAGGIEAARAGHDVIMTPTDYCYFNDQQVEPDSGASGWYLTLRKAYSFEPTPPVLDSAAAGHILGAQGNLWTENIATPEQAEYMVVPRMLALSEVIWSPAEIRDWRSFRTRLEAHFPRFQAAGINYCRGDFGVAITSAPSGKTGSVAIKLETEQLDRPIRYTLDGSEPTARSDRYREPFTLSESATIAAALIDEEGTPLRRAKRIAFDRHLAVGAPIKFNVACAPKYNGGGEQGINDGLRGSTRYCDGYWRGHEGEDFEARIDLGVIQTIDTITLSCLQDIGVWIFMPDSVVFEISADGSTYTTLAAMRREFDPADQTPRVVVYHCPAGNIPARFVRVSARNIGTCPAWHPGAGGLAWVFVDEIIVR